MAGSWFESYRRDTWRRPARPAGRPRKGTRLLAALGTAAVIAAGGCATTGTAPHPFPVPGPSAGRTAPPADPTGAATPAPDASLTSANPEATPPPTPSLPGAFDGTALSSAALALRGAPYRSGGADPRGFDCSGFTWYVFTQHGVAIPRSVLDQSMTGEPVNRADVKAGDLLFFATTGRGPTHVAIAVDQDAFVHAPSSTGVVRVEHLSAAYWSRRFLSARRVG